MKHRSQHSSIARGDLKYSFSEKTTLLTAVQNVLFLQPRWASGSEQKMKAIFHLVALGILGASTCYANPERTAAFPTHCKLGEFAYLNANMSELHYPQYKTEEDRRTKPGLILKKTGKILSICTDRKAEPFGSVTYRFGAIGHIEFERVADKSSPFYVFERYTGARGGDAVFFFFAAPYTYCVSEATGQGSGISLTVLKAGREIVSLFSGNDRGTDFESGLLDLSFEQSSSPSLELYAPQHPFQTPCDGKRLIRP
jgi:hypothetical protein